MKKHLLAAAVAAAVAAPAMAQNVTLYGTFDASYSASDTGAAANSNAQAMTDSAISSSVFGIRGSEDLGGGLRAIFNMEGDVSLANGQTRTDSSVDQRLITNVGAGDAMFRRAAFAGLASSQWGELTLGRRISPAIAVSQGLAVMSGNSVGSANQFTQGTAVNFFTRQAITYVSPKFMGADLTVQQGISGGLISGGLAATGAADATLGTDHPADTRGVSSAFKTLAMALNYANGPWTAGLAQQTVNNNTGDKDHEFMNARVHYKMGDFTLGFGFQDVKIGNAATVFNRGTAAGPNVNNRSNVYSLAYQFRPTTAVGASLTQNDKAGTLMNIQVRESLSKSTTLYGQYGVAKADTAASVTQNFVSSWGTLAAPGDGLSATTVSVGIIKSF